MNKDQTTRHLLSLPPIEWPEAINRLTKRLKPHEAQELVAAMADDIGRLAYLSEYLSVRSGATGCGQHPHKSAAKQARRMCVKVNRALGYQYAERRAFDL